MVVSLTSRPAGACAPHGAFGSYLSMVPAGVVRHCRVKPDSILFAGTYCSRRACILLHQDATCQVMLKTLFRGTMQWPPAHESDAHCLIVSLSHIHKHPQVQLSRMAEGLDFGYSRVRTKKVMSSSCLQLSSLLHGIDTSFAGSPKRGPTLQRRQLEDPTCWLSS